MNNHRRTIPEALFAAANNTDKSRGYSFVADDGKTESHFSFAQLASAASRIGSGLLRLGLRPGDRVGLVLPRGDEFVLTFLGAMCVGLVPVPMYPPLSLGKLGNYLEHSRHIIQKSECAWLITDDMVGKLLGSLIGGYLRGVATVAAINAGSDEAPLAKLELSHPAFIQFTSGSTSRPKGVVLTHGNLAANAHCIMRLGLRATPDDKGCTWLPFYHDMGLIGFVLAPLMTDTPVAFMPPLLFLKRPVEWFRLITRHRGTIGFGPNFAYGLCTARIKDAELQDIDLSSWRVAGCGAEPVVAGTLQAFCERFRQSGFDSRAMMPCYGMAESTLAVSFSPVGGGVVVHNISASYLTEHNEARPPKNPTDSLQIVSCGQPFEGHELLVVDPDTGTPLQQNRVGEIVLRGPSVMQSYYNDPDITDQTIRNGYLHTGDLGYLNEGNLYVCGRIKDLIIVAGKNYYPTDIEWAVSQLSGVRTGNVAAFGLTAADGKAELVVVCAEAKETADASALIQEIRGRVMEFVGIRIDEVVLLAPGSLPKTSSGKLQRRQAKQMYVEGTLEGAWRREGKLDLLKHLAVSQWGYLKKRIGGVLPGTNERN
ncbi:MAG: fatty acyl-AMP ligase [Myxococcales bacterium]|nr:fatty acyl-AMP ligase [Myxococcales bacterium]